MKTIIHIGQHKTGTTSIQHYLQDNRQKLAQSGFYVPAEIIGYDDPSHWILNVYSLAEGRFSPKKETLVKQMPADYFLYLEAKLKHDLERIYAQASQAGCDALIWSNEGLYLLNSEAEYRRLIDLFAAFTSEFEVVCCFRDLPSYTKSYIHQLTKSGIPLSDDPDSYRYVQPDSWLFDYARKQALLANVFDQCTFFPYDPQDNVKRFLEKIGVPGDGTGTYRANVS
jgi:hypothetical protein